MDLESVRKRALPPRSEPDSGARVSPAGLAQQRGQLAIILPLPSHQDAVLAYRSERGGHTAVARSSSRLPRG